MIVELYVMLFIISIIIFILGIRDDAIAYQAISAIMFMLLTGLAFYITIPLMDPTGTVVEHRYIEWGLVAICPVFVFINLVMMMIHWFSVRKMKRGELPYVPPGHQ